MFDWDEVPDDLDAYMRPLGRNERAERERPAPAARRAALSYEINGVALAANTAADGRATSSALVPELPAVRGLSSGPPSTAALAGLRWMMQKATMRQDMFLLGPPGPLARHLVLRFCKLLGREVEYVGITRDTNEADLKQRREIRGGRVEYVDQAPVRAALHGRVLVLEGIEKAERNVLPLLNNLLENREMQLEDGRFLMAPERAEQLRQQCEAAQMSSDIAPVHPDFIVVAIGIPGRGNPLDPPLRSRFSAFVVLPTEPSEALAALSREVSPTASSAAARCICEAAGILQKFAKPEGKDAPWSRSRVPAFPEGGVYSAARLLAAFPELAPVKALRRAYPCEHLRLGAAQLEQVGKILKSAGVDPALSGAEYGLMGVKPGGRAEGPPRVALSFTCAGGSGRGTDVEVPAGRWFTAAPAPASAEPPASADAGEEDVAPQKLSVKELKRWLADRGVKHSDCLEKADLVRRAQEHLAKAPAAPPKARLQGVFAGPIAGSPRLVATQARVVSAMLADHAVGMDTCLVGDKGVGKSVLIRAFAGLLGYRCRLVFCYKDMISRDLLQRRTTDPRGNTEWRDSPLVEAAICGDLAVLDGMQRLATGTLYSTLGTLLADRETVLPDGSWLVSPARWQGLLEQRGLPADTAELSECGARFRPVHPAFRCIAAAEPPGAAGTAGGGSVWLDDEVATLFHFHAVKPLPDEEQLALTRLKGEGFKADAEVFRGLFRYGEQIRNAAADDPNLEPLQLSIRVLLRIARHLHARPGDVEGALNRSFSACLRFLPPSSQEAVDRLLVGAMRGAGVKLQGLQRAQVTAPSQAETNSRRQDLRALENTAIQARMMGGYGGGAVDEAREKADKARQDQRKKRLEELRKKAASAAKQKAPEGAKVLDGVLQIGDVRCPVRTPTRPELVPDVSFVDIPKHVEVLRDMLLDWSLGHHLLLVGNQGVGKNKLTDRLLCLLRCEREYVQLHRDTTVQSLTLAPKLEAGVVVWEDSPLVRAVKHGRCLVVDEADKAPLEVVCVLKALCEDGQLGLLDGRTIVQPGDPRLLAVAGTPAAEEFVPAASGFQMIVLANRPGYPFLGNDFFRVCGDVFSCHAVDNPDIESEVTLLRSVGPDVPQERIVQLSLLFTELRDLVEAGQLAYPYSTRELVKLVSHMQRFPADPVEQASADVFAFDVVDEQKRGPLLEVLKRHGIAVTAAGEALLEGRAHGDMNLKLDEHRDKSKDVRIEDNPDGSNPPPMGEGGPKHGKWDGQQHIGGNVWAGGSGGTGTAGLGGRWGPYRLDVGQELVSVSEDKKGGIDEETQRKTRQMAEEAYKKRLEEIKMSTKDAEEYAALRGAVATQIQEMKVCLEGQEAREKERQWLKNQTHGELDDNRLVDGITGSRTIYTRRGEPDDSTLGASQKQPKRITFVMDISGSMYTFNRIDRRLQRLQEVAAFIFESFAGFEEKYDYRMVGHSGSGPEAERLVEWGRPPRTEKERHRVAKTMEAHAQYCNPGDHTLDGTARAIDEIGKHPADERFVFVVSDADLQRYNIDVKKWGQILQKNPLVKAYVILISNNVDEAERIKATLAPGRAHICAEAASLAVTFKQIFKDSMLRDS